MGCGASKTPATVEEAPAKEDSYEAIKPAVEAAAPPAAPAAAPAATPAATPAKPAAAASAPPKKQASEEDKDAAAALLQTAAANAMEEEHAGSTVKVARWVRVAGPPPPVGSACWPPMLPGMA